MKKGLCADLMLTFMKIGLFTFGGGYAMISMISDICVEKKKWITHDEMMNVTVVAESTPGPIAINCATFVGWRQAGMAGALCATLGIVLPSFAVIYAIARFCEGVAAPVWALNAFRGVKAAVGILILNAAVTMIRKMPKKRFPLAVMGVSCAVCLIAALFGRHVSSILLMAIAGVVSLSVWAVKGAPKKGGERA